DQGSDVLDGPFHHFSTGAATARTEPTAASDTPMKLRRLESIMSCGATSCSPERLNWSSLTLHARDVPHLSSWPRLALAVDVDVRAALGDELGPALDVVADEIFHDCAAAREADDAGWEAADGTDVLLEL